MKQKKIIISVIFLAVILILGAWIKSRWGVWFVSVDEVEFTYTGVPDRVTLTPGADFCTERTISWRCDTVVKSSRVLLVHDNDTVSIKADGEIVESRAGKDAFYKVCLDNLTPGEAYSYVVETENEKSQWHNFRMPSKDGARKILYVGDVQDTIGGNSPKMFEKLYQKYKDADLWAFGGDLIEAPIDKYWSWLYDAGKDCMGNVTMVCATGNHEYFKTLYRMIDPRWYSTFVFPDNGASLMKGRSYYVESEDMLFMVIDTNGLQDPFTLYSEYNWLRDLLIEKGNGKWKFLMFHHPIFSVRAKKNNYIIRNTFLPLIEKYGVDVVLQGHEHGYSRKVVKNDKNGESLFIVSHASPKKYRTIESSDETKVIRDTEMYQVIDFDDNKLQFKAYDLWSDELLDEYTLTKNNNN